MFDTRYLRCKCRSYKPSTTVYIWKSRHREFNCEIPGGRYWYPGAKSIKKNTNSTQNKSQTHRAKQYEVTSFLSTDCELSTEICSKNVYSLGPRYNSIIELISRHSTLRYFESLIPIPYGVTILQYRYHLTQLYQKMCDISK